MDSASPNEMVMNRLRCNSARFAYLELGKASNCSPTFLDLLAKNHAMTTVMIAPCFFDQFFAQDDENGTIKGERIILIKEKGKLLDDFLEKVMEMQGLLYLRLSLRHVSIPIRHVISAKLAAAISKNTTDQRLKISVESLDLNVFLENVALWSQDINPPTATTITDNGDCTNHTIANGIVGMTLDWIDFKNVKHKAIHSMTLACNDLSDEDCKPIAAFLSRYTMMRSLTISENQIGAAGCRYLAEGLRQTSTLETLNLSRNRINDEGVFELAKGIRHNHSLRKLDLSCNERIGEEGWNKLADLLEEFHTKLVWFGVSRISNKRLKFFLRLNKAGRHDFLHSKSVTRENLIQSIMKSRGNVRSLYYFLSCRPELCDI